MATFLLEDLRGSIEVFVFPKVMQVFGALLSDDGVVVVKGRVDTRDEQVKLVCMEMTFPTLVAEGTSSELRLRLPLNALTDGLLEDLKAVLVQPPGGRAGLLERGPDDPQAPRGVQREQRSRVWSGRVGRLARAERGDPRARAVPSPFRAVCRPQTCGRFRLIKVSVRTTKPFQRASDQVGCACVTPFPYPGSGPAGRRSDRRSPSGTCRGDTS